jgi:hypothetical protein
MNAPVLDLCRPQHIYRADHVEDFLVQEVPVLPVLVELQEQEPAEHGPVALVESIRVAHSGEKGHQLDGQSHDVRKGHDLVDVRRDRAVEIHATDQLVPG